MGYDAENNLAPGTRLKDLEEYLVLLGFERLGVIRSGDYRAIRYWHYDEDDFERFQGLSADTVEESEGIQVHTRTLISRNKADSDVHNRTLRMLRKRFGGHFVSDYGKNRYFPWDGVELRGAEAGCYMAYWRFTGNIFKIRVYLASRSFSTKIPLMEDLDPETVANNLLLPFLVATVEEFLQSAYKAILKFSDRRVEILRGIQIRADVLVDDLGQAVAPEEVVCRAMSFQNISKAARYFVTLDSRLDIEGALRRPYRRRKKTLLDSLEAIVRSRHSLVHRAEIDIALSDKAIERAVSDIAVSMRRIYEHIIEVFSWNPNEQD